MKSFNINPEKQRRVVASFKSSKFNIRSLWRSINNTRTSSTNRTANSQLWWNASRVSGNLKRPRTKRSMRKWAKWGQRTKSWKINWGRRLNSNLRWNAKSRVYSKCV